MVRPRRAAVGAAACGISRLSSYGGTIVSIAPRRSTGIVPPCCANIHPLPTGDRHGPDGKSLLDGAGGTVTVVGTTAIVGSLLVRAIVTLPGGAGPFSTTPPVAGTESRVGEVLTRLRHDAQIGFRGPPATRVLFAGFLIRD